jgi:hypothetical protein
MTPDELIALSAGIGVEETATGEPYAVIVGDDRRGFVGAIHSLDEAVFDWYSERVFSTFAEAGNDLRTYFSTPVVEEQPFATTPCRAGLANYGPQVFRQS